MTPDELKKIISRGETLTVEFKSDREKLSDRALVEALAAMANTDGGVLILGIEDKAGEITGLHRQHQNCGTPTAMVANRTAPSLHVAVEEIACDGLPLFVMKRSCSSSRRMSKRKRSCGIRIGCPRRTSTSPVSERR